MDRIDGWGLENVDVNCVLCHEGRETISHLYFNCVYSREAMSAIAQWLYIDHFPMGHSRWRAWLGFNNSRYNSRRAITLMAVAACVYEIWHERNARKHNGRVSTPLQVVECIKRVVQYRISFANRRRLSHRDTTYLVQLLIT